MKIIYRIFYGLLFAPALFLPINAEFQHKILNETPFTIRVSLDYKSFLCKDNSAILIPAGGEHVQNAGICMLTDVTPWFERTPEALAAGIFGQSANSSSNHYKGDAWHHSGFSGDGTWRFTWDAQNKKMVTNVELNSLGNILKQTGEGIGKATGEAAGSLGSLILGPAADLVNTISDLFNSEVTQKLEYCYNPDGVQPPPAEATVDDPAVQKQDNEGLIPYIKKYSPVVWLASKEKAFPIRAPEYFTSINTSIVDTNTKQVSVPTGQVTMRKIYDLYKQGGHRYFEVGNNNAAPKICILAGSNPAFANNHDAAGNLTTPAYVLAYTNPEDDSKILIQYLFFYGLNVPYDIKKLMGIGNDIARAFSGKNAFTDEQIKDWANFHEADLEHITVELDKNTKNITRIHFAAHGSDGVWIPAHDREISWEGTHPVVYSARGSHASYPKEGTYVRIYGFANDETSKGKKWIPQLVRIYKDGDSRFNPDIHGWITHAGTYGMHGVASAQGQVGNAEVKGKNRNSVLFCPPGSGNYICTKGLAAAAKP